MPGSIQKNSDLIALGGAWHQDVSQAPLVTQMCSQGWEALPQNQRAGL